MRITPRQVEASYEIAARVFDHDMTSEAGAKTLEVEHGLNINSARDLINHYQHMLHGKVFHRTLSAPAIDYYFSKILDERGQPAVTAAISAVEKHVRYYEDLRRVKLKAMRSVIAKHRQITTPPSNDAHEAAFTAAVEKALADSSDKRKARLRDATTTPVRVKVITEVFIRNADVVAEVLLRAVGVCERCRAPAPFKRKRDDTPYLEVHHRKQLSDGGKDTVENAIALCPNCHRDLHYGAASKLIPAP